MVKEEAFKPKKQYIPADKKRFFSPAVIVAILFGALMVTSTIGFIQNYTEGDGSLRYGSHTFKRTPFGFSVTINNIDLEFAHFPDSLLSIPIDQDIIDIIKNSKSMVVTYDPSSPINSTFALIQYNVEQLMTSPLFDIYIERAVTNNTLFPSIKQADCNQATPYIPVLVWQDGNETRITVEGTCIRAIAQSGLDAARLSDRLSYELLGVTSP